MIGSKFVGTKHNTDQIVSFCDFSLCQRANEKWLSNLVSLRSKRFRAVSEQRKTEERDSRFWPREKWNERQKMKEGEGKEGNFLPHPLPAYSRHFSRGLCSETARKRLLRRLQPRLLDVFFTMDEERPWERGRRCKLLISSFRLVSFRLSSLINR